MRLFARTILVLMLLLSGHANASTYSSEITDMWWNPAESGWGVNIILQNNVAFMTFFVYDTDQNPVWYTAQLQGAAFVWSGGLYATTGPWFGGSFPPGSSSIRQAGTARFTLVSLNQATLTYTVDGVSVTKTLQRQTWTNENYTGIYAGGYSIRATSCVPASHNGIQEVFGLLSINQTGSNVFMSVVSTVANCSFSGTYTQAGKLGQVQGTYSCTDGISGTFVSYEMVPTVNGFTAQVSGQNQFCQWDGFFGGIARAQ